MNPTKHCLPAAPNSGMVRLWALFCVWILTLTPAQAQVKLPAFQMTQAGGQVFRAQSLPKDRPVLLVYFSPDCDHCHELMKAYFKRAQDFARASVVMITYQPLDKVALFSKQYGTARYSNITVGTEGTTFKVRYHYKLTEMPFVALHDRNGNLVKSYIRTVPLDDLAARLKKLP
ncbi:MAG TPA: redoxin domain-containing protein [Chitinophagaceae bacterium]|jgi:thiol-disulfide isomerase/thioredoxin|nr:redoxin domain-containing protein [Chitinophagaceae bacterium]